MRSLYLQMLDAMEIAFRALEATLPPPMKVENGEHWVFRPAVKDAYHAIVQKLVVIQSGLRGALILLEHGHIMEQGVLSRVIDEASEDVVFLTYGLINDELTPLHQQYLNSFFAEEFEDFSDVVGTHKSRPTVPRRKIRAYLARAEGQQDPSRAAKVGNVLAKVYSGFVHGASTNIMDTLGGNPPRFHTRGMLGTPRIGEYSADLWNYMYRGFLAHIFAAKAFGAAELCDSLMELRGRFEEAAENSYE